MVASEVSVPETQLKRASFFLMLDRDGSAGKEIFTHDCTAVIEMFVSIIADVGIDKKRQVPEVGKGL